MTTGARAGGTYALVRVAGKRPLAIVQGRRTVFTFPGRDARAAQVTLGRLNAEDKEDDAD